jgi:hypothetical protein
MEIAQQFIYGKDGQVITNAEFSGYRLEQGIGFPQLLTIHCPAEDVDLKITFQIPPELNTGMPASAFQLDTNGAEVIHVSAPRKP